MNEQPFNPWDNLTQDELLVRHSQLKNAFELAKAKELELRRYIVKRAFPAPKEGMNTQELGNGYQLKAEVKYNYNLAASNEEIKKTLDKIAKIGNRGYIVAERLISWKPSFLLTEYRLLQDEANESQDAKAILKEINTILEITDVTPTLTIKEPRIKK